MLTLKLEHKIIKPEAIERTQKNLANFPWLNFTWLTFAFIK